MSGLVLALVIVVVLALLVIRLYNRFVQLRNAVDNTWAQVDVQLRRRYDLIPNPVEAVKGYAAHEREVFEEVTQARTRALARDVLTSFSQSFDGAWLDVVTISTVSPLCSW